MGKGGGTKSMTALIQTGRIIERTDPKFNQKKRVMTRGGIGTSGEGGVGLSVNRGGAIGRETIPSLRKKRGRLLRGKPEVRKGKPITGITEKAIRACVEESVQG